MTDLVPATVFPALRYRDASAALDWLTRAFGFTEHAVHRDDDGVIVHAVLRHGPSMIMFGQWVQDGRLGGRAPDPPAGTVSLYLAVDDPDAHHDRAVAAGAQVVRPLVDQDYGSREYSARDPEGNLWSFGTYNPAAPEPTAADRFRAAARDRDPGRAAAEFADDVQLHNPVSADPLVGRQAVATALAGLDAAFDEFTHLRVLTDPGPRAAGDPDVQAIVFRARIGEQVIEGVDLLEVDDHDTIATFTVLARPLQALQALGQAMTQGRPGR